VAQCQAQALLRAVLLAQTQEFQVTPGGVVVMLEAAEALRVEMPPAQAWVALTAVALAQPVVMLPALAVVMVAVVVKVMAVVDLVLVAVEVDMARRAAT
jgi:hypothetical protein